MTDAALAPPARHLRAALMTAGALLLVAAVIAVVLERDVLGQALQAVRRPRAGPALLLVLAVAANVAMTGLLSALLIRRHGLVGHLEMQALVAAATLLNFLPLKPGPLGRIAYHRAFNAIPAALTVRTMLQAAALSAGSAAYMAGGLAAGGLIGAPLWAIVAAPLPLLAAGAALGTLRFWCGAAALRYLEVLVWAVRYHAAFALVGSPVGPGPALALAAVGMITMLVPFLGNGLGVREWAVGVAAPYLTPYVLAMGLAAELVNRAAEVLVAAVLGGAGMIWLSGLRSRGPAPDGTATS
jgi:hypothetical protein